MMASSRRTHLLLAVLYCLFCLSSLCLAKEDNYPTAAPTKYKKDKDKDDKEDDKYEGPEGGYEDPEGGPEDPEGGYEDPDTKAPTTKKPTDSPTVSPTEFPTEAPSKSPTAPPTQYPTWPPTIAPSEPPTPAPTNEFPVADPTDKEMDDLPPTQSAMVEVKLASMVMDIRYEGGKIDSEMLEQDMEALMTDEILDRVYDSFSHVDLKLTLLDTNSERRQLQESKYVVDIEGTAYFLASNDIPTPEQLSEFLYTYFSIYDSEDLTGALDNGNSAITRAEVVSLDGVPVDIHLLNKDTDEGSSDPDSVALGAIIGLVAGALALVVAFLALVWIRRKNAGDKKGSVATPDRTLAASPHDENDSIDVEDEVSVGISSIDDSIYTHNSNLIIKNPPQRNVVSPPEQYPGDQYDANRLDRVIDNAHSFTRDLSFENVYSEDSGDQPPAISNPVSF